MLSTPLKLGAHKTGGLRRESIYHTGIYPRFGLAASGRVCADLDIRAMLGVRHRFYAEVDTNAYSQHWACRSSPASKRGWATGGASQLVVQEAIRACQLELDRWCEEVCVTVEERVSGWPVLQYIISFDKQPPRWAIPEPTIQR